MTAHTDDSLEQQVWDIVTQINLASRKADINAMKDLVHENITIIFPDFQRRVNGRDTYLESVVEFASRGEVLEFEELEPLIDIFGDTAVVTYRYQSEWRTDDQQVKERGRDMMVLVQREGHWQLSWRTLMPDPFQEEGEE